ncbi:MAG: oligoendopeptidase F [Candidatus Marinimicrobia bacterium]|nr:oligoendopeptidase F [Candidatus Neomarinimicrobiota bacterium]
MRTRFQLQLIVLLALLLCGSVFAEPKTRADIDAAYKWTLEDVYPDWDAWEMDLNKLKGLIDEIAGLKGTLTQGPEQLLKAFQLEDDLGILIDAVYGYPAMTRDLDNRDNEVYAKLQQVQILYASYGTATSWMNPEILTIPWETMKQWLDNTKALAPYRFSVEDLYREQKHVLDAEGEKLLSYFSQFRGNPSDIHNQLSTADIKFETITLSTDEEVTVSPGEYYKILSSNRNQEDRKNAFLSRNGVYNKTINTYAEVYNGICQRDWAMAQARKYGSTLERSLESNNIPVDVYMNLVSTVKKGTAPLQRYHALRKEALGLSEYHLYDSSIPVVEIDENYEYDNMKDGIIKSVKPLGKAYTEKLEQAFTPGWVDVYETEGKTTGAYSGGVYGVHPFMLLNYNNTLDNVFTLAHEMGHTVHTMFAQEAQPFSMSNYTLFVAEVASTMNEALLLDQMLSETKDPKERLVLLSHAINSIEGTFYTQTMWADYELQVHQLAENGQPITAEILISMYHQLSQEYYGESVTPDELYDITWARIGHFYFAPYYVYQYATSFAASAKLHQDITEGSRKDKKAAVERYVNLLKSGGSDYPVDQLKKAGVDMTQPDAVQAVMDQLTNLVDQYEKELKALKLID